MASFDMDSIKSVLANTRFDFGTHYEVTMSIMDSQLTMMAKEVKTPGMTMTFLDNGKTGTGLLLGTPQAVTHETLTITFMSTGKEYAALRAQFMKNFNQDTNSFGYHDEIKFDISIKSYDRSGKPLQEFKFTDAILNNLGGLDFSYDAAQIQVFDVTFSVKKIEHKAL